MVRSLALLPTQSISFPSCLPRVGVADAAIYHIAASATPTRGRHDGKEIDWVGSKAKERTKEEDMAAYKRLRSDGVQPKGIDGSSHLEKHAGSKWEVQSGTVLTGEKKDIRRKERNLDTILGSP